MNYLLEKCIQLWYNNPRSLKLVYIIRRKGVDIYFKKEAKILYEREL